MEQATSGQMGQPAACMIENKKPPREATADAGRLWRTACRTPPTKIVDNFVKNTGWKALEAAPVKACDNSMTF
jgi:hypothetical protein